ncbi:MAG: biotin/lipoyl-containing protein, partial [Pseudomonadota bacterium]
MDVIMPQLGETVAEGVVTRWYKRVGDAVKADEMLFDVETDKVSTEIPAPASGVVAEILVQEGATAKVGSRLAVIRESGASAGAVAAQHASAATAAPQTAMTHAGKVAPPSVGEQAQRQAGDRLSPVVRRLIAEHRLNPADIRGTGRDGRITREDVLGLVAQRGAQGQGEARTQTRAPYTVGTQTRKPLNTVRKRTGDRMLKSWTTAPHVLQAVEADFMRV